MDFRSADERPHDLPAGGTESWTFDWWMADGSLAGWVRYTRLGGGGATYHAHVVGEHRDLLAVVDDEVPLRSSPCEVRTHGLWADHICETPFEHWTLGLEAFAVELDDPGELYGAARGHPVPLGLDVEWESVAPPLARRGEGTGYAQPCRVHGEVLIGPDVIEVDAFGWRSHDWGAAPWWEREPTSLLAIVEGDQWWHHRDDVLTVLDHSGSESVPAQLTIDTGPDGLPTGGALRPDAGVEVPIEIVAVSPVAAGPDPVRRPRALVRMHDERHRLGLAWLGLGPPVRIAPANAGREAQ